MESEHELRPYLFAIAYHMLGSVADAFPHAPLQRALSAPMDQWPATLDAMTGTPRRDAAVTGAR